jgi:uncharacterized membrane protein YraQ (UPF0718 family)
LTGSSFLRDADWRNKVLRDAFGRGFWGFFCFAVAMGAVCYAVKGETVFRTALGSDLELVLQMLPRVVVALSIAALIWVMLPRERITALVGQEAGIAGLVIATLAGTVTPGGPSSAYALLAVLAASGADRGAMVAYITAWATLGMQRILVWDVPFMGAEFAILRILVSLPLPIIAGLIARRLPLQLTIPAHSPNGGGRR